MDAKTKSWVSYVTIIGWVIAFVTNQPPNKEEQASFHIRQSLGVILMYASASILTRLFVSSFGAFGFALSGALYLASFIAFILGLVYAIQGQQKELPFVGRYFQDWFRGL